MVNYTAGPWYFRLEAVRTVIYRKSDIGEEAIAVGAGLYPGNVGNAQLISASPDMLEALSFFCSGGEWGKIKAYIVAGAPTPEIGIKLAKLITSAQVKADEAFLKANVQDKEQQEQVKW